MNALTPILLAILLAAGPVTTLPPTIEKTARELVSNFTVGKVKQATKDFNDELAAMITPAELAALAKQIDAQAGSFLSITNARQYRHEGARVVDVTGRYEKFSVSFRVVFDTYDRVAAVYIDPILPPKVDPALDGVAREFLTDFAAGRYDAAAKSFDSSLRTQLSPVKLAELGKSIGSRFGAFRDVTSANQVVDDMFRVVTILTTYDNGPVEVRVAFNRDGAISGVRIGPLTTAAATPAPAKR